MTGRSSDHRPLSPECRAATAASLFVLYLWAFAYLTDLPLLVFPLPLVVFGVAALALSVVAAYGLAARTARRLTGPPSRIAGPLAAALLALLACAAAHDVARHFALGLPPEATVSGFPRASLYAALAFAAVFAAVWATARLAALFEGDGLPPRGPS